MKLSVRPHCFRRLSAIAAAKEPIPSNGEHPNSLTVSDVSNMPLMQALDEAQHFDPNHLRNILSFLLNRCTSERNLEQGKRLHSLLASKHMLHDRFICNHVVHMYGQCGSLSLAHSAFESTRDKNVYSWTMIISACVHNKDCLGAIHMYRRMQLEGCTPDGHVVSSIFCAINNLSEGKALYSAIESEHTLLSDPVIANSILNMYRKCGSMEEFERVFWQAPNKDEFMWSTMIATKVQSGQEAVAINLFYRMELEGMKVESPITLASLVDACGNLSAVTQGRKLHKRIVECGIPMDAVLLTALVNMYAKCGRVEEARAVFELGNELNLNNVAVSSMIAGYARNGHFTEALKLFWKMEQEGSRADSVTFTHVLYACSHGGFVDQAWEYFTSMRPDRGVDLVAEHYGCVVDLLARAGWIAEAEEFIHRMPVPADAVSWMSLLQACRLHKNAEIGARAAEHVFKLAPHRAGPYSLLTNIYSDAKRWDMAARVQKLMRDRGVRKPGGRSWIEINGKVHEFIVGDSWHPQLSEICEEIQRLSKIMKEAGYVPDTKQVLHDAEEEEKEDILYYHSEKLAMGLGLIRTPEGCTIEVVKNIRVCSDCHTAAKFISLVTNRKIVIRDINLFHHIQDGKCSCRDYW